MIYFEIKQIKKKTFCSVTEWKAFEMVKLFYIRNQTKTYFRVIISLYDKEKIMLMESAYAKLQQEHCSIKRIRQGMKEKDMMKPETNMK